MKTIIVRAINAAFIAIALNLYLPALANHQDPRMEGRGGPSRTVGSSNRYLPEVNAPWLL